MHRKSEEGWPANSLIIDSGSIWACSSIGRAFEWHSNGTRIFEGQELEGEASIKVFPQSHIILVQDSKIRKINASQNGTVNELFAKAFKSNGLKKMKIADASHIAPPSEGTRKGVATAASRASEAKEDFEWDE